MSDTTITRTADFVDTIGMNTHVPYTDGKYSDTGRIEQDLAYLGIDNVRDNITNGEYGSATLSTYIALAKTGLRFDAVVENSDDTPAKIDARLKLFAAVEAAVPGSIRSVEGWNEVNNFGGTFQGQTGEAGAEAAQAYIYSKVKSDPILGSIPVVYFTGYEPGSTDPSTTPGLADYDNQHSYPQNQAPAFYQLPSTTLVNETRPGKFEYTETGYSTAPGGVTPREKATNSLDLFLDAAKDGSAATYDYELLDAYAPGTPNGGSYLGLFGFDNTPTPAATALHNLTTLLNDDGADASTFTTHAVGYSLSGAPVSGNSMELQKSSGATDIVVWAETPTGSTAATTPTTINLDGKYDAQVFDPLTGTAAIATYSGVSSVTVGITDHPVIVELTQATGDGASEPPVTTDPGTGGSTTTPPATGSGDGGSTTTPPVTTPPVTTDPGTGTTTPTGGSTTTPPVTTPPVTTVPSGGGDTGSTPITTDPGTGSTTSPVTTTPTTPAGPGIDVGALTAEITKEVTASVTSSVLGALHDKAVARFDLVVSHDQAIARDHLVTWVNDHSHVIRGDLLGTAIADAVGPGGYRAARLALQGADSTGAPETVGWMDHTLGLGNAPVKEFLSSVHDAHAVHQGATP